MRARATLLALAMFSLAAGPAPAKPAALAAEITILETSSRVKLGKEPLSLALDGKSATHALKIGGTVEGFTVKSLARPVRVNDGPEGTFIELTVLAADGSESGYLAVTIPKKKPPVFSAAIKLRAATDLTLVLTLP